ncbi:MAG: site-2 protease family protein, partial [Phycisphaerales bacterium]|nr:site-2 protease family protein [Phycisphaerales bacterium]
MLTTLLNVLLMVVGFGLLIFVHELGHFLAAKWAGIRTDGFAVGMGPVMFSYRRGVGLGWGPSEPRVKALTGRGALDLSDADLERLGIGETEYSLRWLPVGGFVKMLGQDDMDPGSRSADPRSYTMCPVGKRMIVVSAGVVMNIILALVLFVVCFLVGVRFEAPVVGEVVAGLPAAEAHVVNGTALGITEPGIRPGDTVISVDGDPIVTFADLQMATAMAKPDTALTVIAERPGVETPLEFTLTPRKDPGSGLLSVGIAPASTTTLLDGRGVRGLDEALAGAGLTAQGVEPGATIVSVDGVPVEHYADLDRQATIAGGRPLTAVWMQPGQDPAEADRFVTATIGVEPVFEMFWQPALETGGPAEGDAALIGLSPLHRVTSTTPGGPADGVLMPGDLVLGVAGVSHPTLSTIRRTISTNKGEVIDLRVLRDGVEEVVSVRVRAKTGTIGIALEPAYDLNRIAAPIRDRLASAADPGSVVPTPVAAIEIPPNARIDAIDGTSTSNWTDMYRALLASTAGAAASGTGATVTLSITRPLPNEPRAEVPVALDAADVR